MIRFSGTQMNLASLLLVKGDVEGAETLFREGLARHRRVLGDEHPDIAAALDGLAEVLVAKGDLEAIREQRWRIQRVSRAEAERIYAELERYYFRGAGERGKAWAQELRALIDAR